MSERVRQGFNLLEDVQVVNAALKELDYDTIKVSKDFSDWWNLGLAPDGLIGNLKDLQEEIQKLRDAGINPDNKLTKLIDKDYEKALERFRNDLQKTTNSVLDFINLKGWSKDESKINQVFEQITQKLVLDNQLDPQKAFTLQIEVEEARSKAAREALKQRIIDERAAYKISHDEQLRQSINADVARYNSWNETNGRSKVEWERFTKWLKEQHISETTAMFRNMDEEDIKSLNFQEGKHAEWVKRMVTQYAKEHKMSYDEAFKYLRSWVRSANQWSVFIPLIISSEDKKSVYDQLGEYDKAVDEADAQIERLTKRINELNAKKKKSKEETKELTKAEEELAQAQKDKASAEAKGGHGKKEKKDEKDANKAANKAENQAESELQKALKEEIALINNARSSYDKLAKAGYKNKDILSIVSNQFGSTIAHINKVLGKNGIPLFDINSISGADNPKLEQEMLKAQTEAAKKARRVKPSEIKDLEVEYSKVTVDAKVFDFSQLTKQLENKANMLKDEYELSLEISSDPNLGNLFLNAFDINIDTLPSTAKEYADMLTVEVNKYLKGKNVGFTLPTINLTKDDIAAFEKLKDEKKISEEVYNTLVKYSKTANDAIKKENISTAKSFNTLYSQYADLDTKLTKVQQDAAAEQLTLIKKYGSSEDIKTALNLIEQMSIDATPADINRLSKQLIDVTNRVAKKAEGKGAIKLYNAINTKNTKDVAKTTWDDFKDSEYYSMMFDNMEKLSVKSISEIMAKLDELKDKVKEDPASMKALMDAYNNAEKELIKKKPFDSIIKSLIKWRKAAQEVKVAQGNLGAANVEVKRAEIGLSGAQALGDKKAIAEATEKLTKAQEKQKKATKELKQAENQEAQAQSEFAQSLNAASSACSDVSSMLSQIVSLLGLAEDSDAAVVINSMAKAFSALGTVLGVVAAMAIIAKTSLAWIGWAAMALSAIVGLLSAITNAKNNKINKQIKESELAVKRLENTYKNLEDAINNAFGASIIGAKQAAIENKKLQLVELERQLALEQSRTGKHYDADKVEDLKGKVIDLRNELKNSMQNLSNDLLGISSVSDAAQNFMKDYIDALRKGEDAQKVFAGSFKDMIATMITQLYVAKVVAPRLQEIMDSLNQAVTDRTKDEAKAYQDAVAWQTHYSTMSNDDIKKELAKQRADAAGTGLLGYFAIYHQLQDAEIEELKKEIDKNVIEAKRDLDKASVPTIEDMDNVAQQGQDMLELMKQSEEGLKDLLNRYDLYDDGSNKNLSALQQGIQGITEDTAGALEGYMNGVSQQVYYHSSLLEQIRDAVVGFDMDVQMGTFSQMLLQLQNSYTLMQTMQTMMENWTIPSGSGIRVQLLS
jgi:hypothetical protein